MGVQWQTWDTSHNSGDSVAYWADVVARGVIDANLQPLERTQFNGELASRTVGETRFVNFHTRSHGIRRSLSQARNGHGLIMVGLQCRGISVMDQGDSQVRLLPGQIALIDSNAPFDILFPETVQRRLVLLPRRQFATVCDERRVTGAPIVISQCSGSALLAQDAIIRLTDPSTAWNARDCSAMTQALVSLLAACLGERDSTADQARTKLPDIHAYMRDNLRDAALDPLSAARAVGLSTRSFYRAFAESGQTFSRTLLNLRLAHARALIAREAERSLTEIALDSGFSDSAHFSRSYRAAFGETPRQTRARLRPR